MSSDMDGSVFEVDDESDFAPKVDIFFLLFLGQNYHNHNVGTAKLRPTNTTCATHHLFT
jgi:hypothetical protein